MEKINSPNLDGSNIGTNLSVKESPEFTTSEVKHLYSPAISHICDAVSVVTTQQISEIYFQCFCRKLLNKSGHDLFLLLSAQ